MQGKETHVHVPSFEQFSLLTVQDVKALIEKDSNKSCYLDPMPTQLVLSCLDSLLPVLTRIINLSLESGVFATDWKEALILPLIKKKLRLYKLTEFSAN